MKTWTLAICLLASPLALANQTIRGEVRVEGETVYLETASGRVEIGGRETPVIGEYLGGRSVTVRGELYVSGDGPFLLLSDVVSPPRQTIEVGGPRDPDDDTLEWQGQRIRAAGLHRLIPRAGATIDAFAVEADGRLEVLIVVGVRARVGVFQRWLPREAWIRDARLERTLAQGEIRRTARVSSYRIERDDGRSEWLPAWLVHPVAPRVTQPPPAVSDPRPRRGMVGVLGGASD